MTLLDHRRGEEPHVVEEIRIAVRTENDVLRARHECRCRAEKMGFDGIRTATLEIAVSELGLNLVKHRTVDGVLSLRTIALGRGIGLEILSEDRGPGIAAPLDVMEDGISTAGSLGIGLSGVRRMMDEFKLSQIQPLGTRVAARKWLHRDSSPRLGVSVFNRPRHGETESGDIFFLKQHEDYSMFGVVDALGHGPGAHAVARRTLLYLESCFESPLENIFAGCHAMLQGSRGVVMALAQINNHTLRMRFMSVGNIETRLCLPEGHVRLESSPGTLGLAFHPRPSSLHALESRTTIVMHSDGIRSHFDIPPNILLKREQEIAWHIFENYSKWHDDVTVIVARLRS